ncbi:hypothetical protein NMY22_g9146 [Coprinellus aureogranulatus]|nr:hypothetical protein NMY22_g9146 [Coprinellus aureogranulatus]
MCSENGTVYVDHDFADTLREGQERASRWPAASRMYKKVKNLAGQTLLAISIPHYKRWKATLTPGEVVWLSPKYVAFQSFPNVAKNSQAYVASRTYIRHEDVDEIERLLLDDPDFTDIELSGIRITRSFLEAALAY